MTQDTIICKLNRKALEIIRDINTNKNPLWIYYNGFSINLIKGPLANFITFSCRDMLNKKIIK